MPVAAFDHLQQRVLTSLAALTSWVAVPSFKTGCSGVQSPPGMNGTRFAGGTTGLEEVAASPSRGLFSTRPRRLAFQGPHVLLGGHDGAGGDEGVVGDLHDLICGTFGTHYNGPFADSNVVS